MEGLAQQQPASPDSPAGGLTAAAHSTAAAVSEVCGTGPSTFDGGGRDEDANSTISRPTIKSPSIKDNHDDEGEVTSGGGGKTIVSEAVTSRILPADVLTRQDSRTTHSTPEGNSIFPFKKKNIIIDSAN